MSKVKGYVVRRGDEFLFGYDDETGQAVVSKTPTMYLDKSLAEHMCRNLNYYATEKWVVEMVVQNADS